MFYYNMFYLNMFYLNMFHEMYNINIFIVTSSLLFCNNLRSYFGQMLIINWKFKYMKIYSSHIVRNRCKIYARRFQIFNLFIEKLFREINSFPLKYLVRQLFKAKITRQLHFHSVFCHYKKLCTIPRKKERALNYLYMSL